MTITVVCGQGHITKYNLIEIPKYTAKEEQGDIIKTLWRWENWKCPTPGCKHKEYINHTKDNKLTIQIGEETETNKTQIAILTTLALLLTIKNTMGI